MAALIPFPAGFKVVCSVCGEARDANADFSKGQLKKKHPRCRSCAPNKFSNQSAGGHQSRRENRAVVGYRALAQAGVIFDFGEQVSFELIPAQRGANGKVIERACSYVADVVYKEPNGTKHVVDIKGFRTDVYRLKRKLMLFIHGIRIEEQ